MLDDYIVLTGINIVLAWSVYVILLSGSLSFANGAFMALGAYGAGVLTVRFGWDLVPAALVAGLGTAVFGALVGFPALRTRGIYLILLTTGVAVAVQSALQSMQYVGGVGGMSGLVGTTPWHVAGLVVLVGAGLFLLGRSPLQRVLDAVREDEIVAAGLGIRVVYVKLLAFAAGAFLAALAGALYGHYLIFISPEQFSVVASVFVVLYATLGGTNNMWGPALGATIMTLLPELVRGLQAWRPMAFGVAILLLLLLRPEGLLAFRTRTARSR